MRVEVRPCYHSATDYDVVLDGVLVARFFGEMAAMRAGFYVGALAKFHADSNKVKAFDVELTTTLGL